MSDARGTGRVERVNGPLVEVAGLGGVAALDVIEVGPLHIAAEVVSIQDGRLTAEAFEYTGGLRVGDAAVSRNQPLSARLGPGLLGGVFDGLLRPLEGGPTWLAPGGLAARTTTASWPFRPVGIELGSDLAPGTLLGTVTTGANFEHRILVPPGVSGPLTRLAPAGTMGEEDVVAEG